MQKRIFLHIAFWLCYILFKTSQNLSSDLTGSPDSFTLAVLKVLFTAQLVFLIVKVPMVYALFYITRKYLAKQWSIAQTIIAGFIVFILSLAVFLPVKQFIVIEGIYKIDTSLAAALNYPSIFSSLFILLFVSSVALTIKLIRTGIKQKEKEQEIINKKLETELQFLKAQTNPHFLFNTLNNIYALARKKSDNTPEAVMKLSKLLRFMLYESQKPLIPLKEEVQVLNDYLELERIRYNEKLKMSFVKSIDDETQPIAPLILLPFVENAFKHGVGESRFGSSIYIDLKLTQGNLYFRIENSISTSTQNLNLEKLGLKNIKRQLELLYPGHRLEIENDETHFAVTLTLKLLKNAIV
jgi:two-component system, LytTR family, sensor kinase